SMSPAVKAGDVLLYYRLNKNYVASDVLALEYEGEVQTRRVVAIEGDTVDITEEGVIINGNLQVETQISVSYTHLTLPTKLAV
ncbi:signal peptidase I, partial [Enterococcus sp. S181_ASV_20]|nr:signal peptidase I [Enterococcus sp. S181_ASV_20]